MSSDWRDVCISLTLLCFAEIRGYLQRARTLSYEEHDTLKIKKKRNWDKIISSYFNALHEDQPLTITVCEG